MTTKDDLLAGKISPNDVRQAKIDGAQALSQVSGLSRAEILEIWEKVKLNNAKLNGCLRHRFVEESVILGQKLTCQACGGNIGLSDAGHYIRGYVAAGGKAEDIWPGFEAKYVIYREL